MTRLAVSVLLCASLSSASVRAEEPVWRLSDSFGEKGRGKNELREPVDIVLMPDDGIAVLDADREAVVLFSRLGRWVRTLGGRRGEGELRLDRPRGLALGPGGNLWIADTGNHRLVVVDAAGAVLRVVGELGSGKGRFRNPTDIAVDRSGRVYVADSGNERVQVLRPDGGVLDSWDRRTGGRRDHMGAPVGLAYSDQGRGNIWILNEGWGSAERFELDGQWVESLAVDAAVRDPVRLAGIDVEPVFYKMFFADAAGGRILALDRRGALIAQIGGPEGESAEFRGLAVNRSLDVYVCDAAGGRVLLYEPR